MASISTHRRIQKALSFQFHLLPTTLQSSIRRRQFHPLSSSSYGRYPRYDFVRTFCHTPIPHNERSYEIQSFTRHFDGVRPTGVNEFINFVRRNAHKIPPEGEDDAAFLEDLAVEPSDDFLYSAVWSLREDWKLAFLVFKWGERRGCAGERCWLLLIWVLGNHKKFNMAWCLIRDLHRASLDAQQAMLIMMDRYAAANDPGEAMRIFQLIDKFKLSPDRKALYTLLTVLCKHGNVEEAEEFMLSNRKLFPLETEGFNIILNGWCNISTDIYEAKRIWREMSRNCIVPNATSYTHIISCFSKVGNLFDSLRFYDQMKKRGWVPGLAVYNALINVLSSENCLAEALKIVDKMKELGVSPDSATYNSMILPLCKEAKIEEARSILATMERENICPTLETYHAFLHGGLSLEETLRLLDNMRKSGLGPSKVTFLLILGYFFKSNEPENALYIWREMKRFDVVPGSEHYSVVVEGLAIGGSLAKARELYEEMRSNGVADDPSLRKLLKVPGDSCQEVRSKQMGIIRCIKKGVRGQHSRRRMARKRNGKRLRKKDNQTTSLLPD